VYVHMYACDFVFDMLFALTVGMEAFRKFSNRVPVCVRVCERELVFACFHMSC